MQKSTRKVTIRKWVPIPDRAVFNFTAFTHHVDVDLIKEGIFKLKDPSGRRVGVEELCDKPMCSGIKAKTHGRCAGDSSPEVRFQHVGHA